MKAMVLALAALLAWPASGKSVSDEEAKRAAKKGALKERSDPAQDLRAQERNARRLDDNAKADRRAKNTVGAWAAERDARRARKLVHEDRQRLRENKNKKAAPR